MYEFIQSLCCSPQRRNKPRHYNRDCWPRRANRCQRASITLRSWYTRVNYGNYRDRLAGCGWSSLLFSASATVDGNSFRPKLFRIYNPNQGEKLNYSYLHIFTAIITLSRSLCCGARCRVLSEQWFAPRLVGRATTSFTKYARISAGRLVGLIESNMFTIFRITMLNIRKPCNQPLL